MRNSALASMFLVGSLLGAASCVGDTGEAEVAEQTSDALLGVADDPVGDEANPADDTNPTAFDLDRDDIFQCPNQRLCLWNNSFYTSTFYQTQASGCTNLPSSINDRASSWYNRHNANYYLYRNANCQGARVTAYSDLSNPNMTGAQNNSVSSVCRGAGCP